MEISELKNQKQEKVSQLITECGMFFAFSTEQFEKNKTPLKDGEKYVRMFGGGFMPKGNLEQWVEGSKAIELWYRGEMKNEKMRRANIAYELSNHEAFYTGNISDTLEALGEDYTYEEVRKVYFEELKNQD